MEKTPDQILNEYFSKGNISSAIGRMGELGWASLKATVPSSGSRGHLDMLDAQKRLFQDFWRHFNRKRYGKQHFNMAVALYFWTRHYPWYPSEETMRKIADFAAENFSSPEQQAQRRRRQLQQQRDNPEPTQPDPIMEFERAAAALLEQEFLAGAWSILEAASAQKKTNDDAIATLADVAMKAARPDGTVSVRDLVKAGVDDGQAQFVLTYLARNGRLRNDNGVFRVVPQKARVRVPAGSSAPQQTQTQATPTQARSASPGGASGGAASGGGSGQGPSGTPGGGAAGGAGGAGDGNGGDIQDVALPDDDYDRNLQAYWERMLQQLPRETMTRSQFDQLAKIVVQDMIDKGALTGFKDDPTEKGTSAPETALGVEMMEFNAALASSPSTGTSVNMHSLMTQMRKFNPDLRFLTKIAVIGKQHRTLKKIYEQIALDRDLNNNIWNILACFAMAFRYTTRERNSAPKGTNGEWVNCTGLARTLEIAQYTAEDLQKFDQIGEAGRTSREQVANALRNSDIPGAKLKLLLAAFAAHLHTPKPKNQPQQPQQDQTPNQAPNVVPRMGQTPPEDPQP